MPAVYRAARAGSSRLKARRGSGKMGSARPQIITRAPGATVPLENVKAIVLAAGRGERMKSARAKVLHDILGAPVLSYVLTAAHDAGLADVMIVVGHQADEVKKAAGDGYAFVTQPEVKGTGEAVLRCAGALKGFDGDVVVLCGDAPLVPASVITTMVHLHRHTKAAATVFTACIDDPAGYGRIVRDSQGRFVKIVEHDDATKDELRIDEVNSGTYVFRACELFEALGKLTPSKKGELYLPAVLAAWVAADKLVETVRSKNPPEAFGINTRKDLLAATNYMRWKILDHHLAQGVGIVDASTTFIEQGVEIGQDTIVHPFTVIRRGVKIGSRCQVGPFAHLRDGTVLEDEAEIGNFVEVKKSRVGRHSKAKHLSYLGDATIGAKVNIGAGTITANYDGKHKHPTVIEDGAFTGCNTVLVAPVKLGKNSKTGAGAVVPRGRDVKEGEVVAGVPARPLKKKP